MTHIRTCIYHDSSTKGFKHGIKHKRHDCWRGEISVFQRGEISVFQRGEISVFQRGEDGKLHRTHRIRKRFATPEQAKEWTKTHDVSRTQQP